MNGRTVAATLSRSGFRNCSISAAVGTGILESVRSCFALAIYRMGAVRYSALIACNIGMGFSVPGALVLGFRWNSLIRLDTAI